MKTKEEILKEKYLHALTKQERVWILDAMQEYADQVSIPIEPLVMEKITDIASEALDEWKTKIIGDERTEQDELCEKIADMQVNNFTVYLLKKISESNFTV